VTVPPGAEKLVIGRVLVPDMSTDREIDSFICELLRCGSAPHSPRVFQAGMLGDCGSFSRRAVWIPLLKAMSELPPELSIDHRLAFCSPFARARSCLLSARHSCSARRRALSSTRIPCRS
jgi:hypothetical protein